MKTVVITGSARGLGLEMAKCFRTKNFNVVISDLFKKDLDNAKKELLKVKGNGDIDYFVCDITNEKDIINLIDKTRNKYNNIDFWINNAGINQPNKMIWDLTSEEINRMLEIDLKGTMIASKLIAKVMIEQGNGSIYNVEGHGSNDAIIPGLSVYGTAKRAVTYYTTALDKEMESSKVDVIVGRLSPGIMITDFLVNSFRNNKMELSDKNKKVYNILGDYPDVVAKFLVSKMLVNTNNNVKINWLTSGKAAIRFMTAGFNKRDFFKDN